MDIISKFNLPSYIKGKTFAQASKIIDDRFKDRNDPDSRQTLAELQGRLQQAQEFVKQEQAKLSSPKESNSFNHGGYMSNPNPTFPANPSDLINSFKSNKEALDYANPYPERSNRWHMFDDYQNKLKNSSLDVSLGTPDYGNKNPFSGSESMYGKSKSSNKYFLGGFLEKLGGGEGQDAQMKGLGNAVGAVSGAAKLANLAFGEPNVDTSGRSDIGDTPSAGQTALGGAMTGAKAGMAFGPLGAGIGGLVGGVAGLIGGNKRKDAESEARFNNALYKNKELSNRYDYGGKLEKSSSYDDGGYLDPEDPFNFEQENYNDMSLSGGGVRNLDIVDLNPVNEMKDDEILDTVMDEEELDRMKTEDNRLLAMMNGGVKPLTTMKAKGIDTSIFPKTDAEISNPYTYPSNDSDTEKKFNPAELLRYAPAGTNLAQLFRMKKPEQVGLDKINTKYQKQLVDEQELQNIVKGSTASNRDAILSSSGGSASAARANLLASELRGSQALSEAYRKASAENRQEGRLAQDFDRRTDMFNVGQSNTEKQINLTREAGYESNRSRLMSQLGQDLGNIGREELLKRYPELMGLSYDWKGNKRKGKKTKQD